MKSSSTQDEKVLEAKAMQVKLSDFNLDKIVQTIDESLENEEFQKHPCFYCDINIANEYHLSEHIIKCRGSHRLFPFLKPVNQFHLGCLLLVSNLFGRTK
jgi:hypothetical protein